jgi:hypothetical protein
LAPLLRYALAAASFTVSWSIGKPGIAQVATGSVVVYVNSGSSITPLQLLSRPSGSSAVRGCTAAPPDNGSSLQSPRCASVTQVPGGHAQGTELLVFVA